MQIPVNLNHIIYSNDKSDTVPLRNINGYRLIENT